MSESIIALIDAEIARLQQARTAIAVSGTNPGGPRKSGPTAPVATPLAKKKKRNISQEGRARIAAAVKARWAAQKKAAK